jgi:hypothetical protein
MTPYNLLDRNSEILLKKRHLYLNAPIHVEGFMRRERTRKEEEEEGVGGTKRRSRHVHTTSTNQVQLSAGLCPNSIFQIQYDLFIFEGKKSLNL